MIRVAHHSEVGGHADNQDAVVVADHPQDAGCLLVAVADGQGGQAGAARAARLACDTVAAGAARLPPQRLTRANVWAEILQEADDAVCRDAEAGYCTLIGLAVCAGRVTGASCGDSAAVLLGGSGIVRLTAQQFKDPPVGSGAALFLSFEADLASPWALLVLTDGVWKYAGWEAIVGRRPDEPAAELIADLRRRAALPRTGGLQDDFTLVVVQG